MTVYAILLDAYQQADGNYHVCFSGTLAECRAQTSFDGSDDVWLKREFAEVSSELATLTDGAGSIYQGRIAGLRPVAAELVADLEMPHRRRRRRTPAGFVALGVAIGMALGRGVRFRSPRRRRRR